MAGDESSKDAKKGGGRRAWRWLAWTLAAAAIAVAVALAVLRAVLVGREWKFDVGLADALSGDVGGIVSNKAVSVRLRVSPHETWDYVAKGSGMALDWPFSFVARLNYSLLGLSASGTSTVTMDETDWRADLRFTWSARGGWTFEAEVPEVRFDENDAFVGDAAKRLASLSGDVSGLALSGRARIAASASTTNGLGAATWEADCWLKDLDASLMNGFDEIAVKKFGVHAGASGFGGRIEIKPAYPRADSVTAAGFALSNAFVTVRATETAFLVTEAGADVWGGKARLYSCFLNRKKLAAGFTLFLDDIDPGQVLSRLADFNGTATGRLHGKLPLAYDDRGLAIGDAYLYSTPGEKGTLSISDSRPFLDKLAFAGVGDADRENMAKVLADMTYDVLNVNLRKEEGSGHALQLKLEGSATDGRVVVPASFNVTWHGDIPQLVNIGIRAAKETEKAKEKAKEMLR